jgi:photosystem II stability/assembly factor-like uncharacterized protein
MTRRLVLLGALLSTLFVGTALAAENEPEGGPPAFKHLKYRQVGPFIGGRVCRSAGVPGQPLIYYVASASGGVWKTVDGGLTWNPILDKEPVASIGSLAVAPSDPNVIYVGSGEANIRGNVAAGNGIYKSVDAGKTWKHVWKQEGQIGTMAVHPTNPDIAYAAVFGHAFGPSEERGVYRTTDGGKSWQRILSKDRDTGASDVCLDPSNPRVLFAGLWQARRRPWEMTSGGPGSGLYTSRDGGDTWKHLTGNGLPEGILGKIGVAVAPSDGRRVYALIEAEKGGLFRSDDGGEKWQLINSGHYLRQRAWYYTTLTIDPSNSNVVWCPSVRMLRSIDGGKTFQMMKGFHHGDHHDIWIDPKDPKRLIASNDGGVDISTTGGEKSHAGALPLCQFYHVDADKHTPYNVSGCMQDWGSACGPSNSLYGSGIAAGSWENVGGGEAGFTVSDPADPDIIYAGEYGGYISRWDRRTRQARNISVYPTNPSGHGGQDLRYRFQWTAPILVSPHDHKVVYHAANVLFRTEDAGLHWTAISPDLTRNEKSKQKWSGGPITGDNTGVEVYDTIFAIAESPKAKGLLWAGSDDGLVHVSRDGGTNWTNVTANIPNMPEWATVTCIEPSPFDAGAAYVVVDAHRMDDTHPYLYKTSDYGKTWKSLTANLPAEVYLHSVREDPKRKGLLYLGTERGVSFSTDDGAAWQELKLNLPTVAVHDVIVKDNDLVLATHGRSIWIFDDLTPIRQMAPAIADSAVHLFPVEPANRYRYAESYERGLGSNPAQGAYIHYYLKKKSKGPVTLEILDSHGNLVNKYTDKAEPPALAEDDPDGPEQQEKKPALPLDEGVNLFAWNLRYKGADIIKGAKIDAGDLESGPLVVPGSYTLKLTAEGKTLSTPVVVQPDPRVHVPTADLEEQVKLALAIRDDASHLTGMVRQLRSVRKQLADRDELLKDIPRGESLIKPSQELMEKLNALEAKLHNPKAEVSYDILAQKGGAQLYSKLGPLYDWTHDSDGPPTQGMRDIFAEETEELKRDEAKLNELFAGDLVKLNEAAKKLELPVVLVPPEKPVEKPPASAKAR